MRFFTRSLLNRNSRDVWQNAIDADQHYLGSVRDRLPATFLEIPDAHDDPVRRVGWCGPQLVEVQAGSYTFVFTDGKLHDFDSNVVGDTALKTGNPQSTILRKSRCRFPPGIRCAIQRVT